MRRVDITKFKNIEKDPIAKYLIVEKYPAAFDTQFEVISDNTLCVLYIEYVFFV